MLELLGAKSGVFLCGIVSRVCREVGELVYNVVDCEVIL